jgi:uncharacterized protein (DUF1800 family)
MAQFLPPMRPETSDNSTEQSAWVLVSVAAAVLPLAACGGGGDSAAVASSVPLEPGRAVSLNSVSAGKAYPAPTTSAQAVRFLLQAQLSASDADIASVQSSGFAKWIQNQIAADQGPTGWDWLNAKGYGDVNNASNFYDSSFPGDYMAWSQLITSPDAARKRMAVALSEIFVVSLNGLDFAWRSHAAAHYWDTLSKQAFGNYRDLLEAITLNPAMGYYLNTKGNKKADGRGSAPDENYAREVMQLFSIGLVELNQDGTPKLVGGNKIDAYTALDVSEFAKAFTGYDLDRSQNVDTPIAQTGGGVRNIPNTTSVRLPMVQVGNNHSSGTINFMGGTLDNSSAPAALKAALDKLFNHANTAPFICKQLIQRLVTSNPSPAYVQRVANVFDNNGSGVRGDLAFVYAAVLLDDEARGPNGLNAAVQPEFGKLREPMLRLVQWARTFGVTSASGAWKIGDLSNAGTQLGQSPLRSPSVFNFFRPGYVPAATALTTGAVAPEFQLVNESSVGGYLNYMQGVIGNGINFVSGSTWDISTPYSAEIALALTPTPANPTNLIDRLNLLLCAGQLSAPNALLITTTVGAMKGMDTSTPVNATKTAANLRNRVCAAVLMVMACAEYLVQK